jgi:hypothetical protein
MLETETELSSSNPDDIKVSSSVEPLGKQNL